LVGLLVSSRKENMHKNEHEDIKITQQQTEEIRERNMKNNN
jgi:hypothetical protein